MSHFTAQDASDTALRVVLVVHASESPPTTPVPKLPIALHVISVHVRDVDAVPPDVEHVYIAPGGHGWGIPQYIWPIRTYTVWQKGSKTKGTFIFL